ncbi:HNH endonuclease (plasmid) [Kalymmatonema gypsitolerans NIES-4073]|nr:HNH endonuclease [Scytonema sp. NIES-4073]
MTEFNSEKFYLGRLCKRGHDFNQTGLSLRRLDNSDCLECMAERDKTSERKAYQKQWRKDNRKRLQAQARKRYQDNPERFRAKNRKTYWSNPEKWRKYAREWHHANMNDAIRVRQRIYRTLNKHRYKFYKHKRRAFLKRSQIEKITQSHIDAMLKTFDECCAYCGKSLNSVVTIDHVIPLSKSGNHTMQNLLPCCMSCNQSKNNSDMIDWYSERDFFTSERLIKICEYLATPDLLQFLEYFKIQLNKSPM